MDSANFSSPNNDFVGSGFKAVFQNSKIASSPPEPPTSPATSPPPLGVAASPPTPVTATVSPPAAPVISTLGAPPPLPPAEVTSFVSSEKKEAKKEKKNVSAKTVVVIGLLVILLGGLVAGFGKIRSFISSAAGTCSPENLSEGNLTSDSIEIVFQTGKACQMEVAYGVSSQALLLQVPETSASLNHRIRLTPLLPSTTYYYQLVAEGKKIGTVRSFLTKAPVTVIPTEEPVPPAPVEQIIPTTMPIVPTQSAGSSASTKTYTYDDFKTEFGGTNPAFDIDKNGMVNRADWLMYQK